MANLEPPLSRNAQGLKPTGAHGIKSNGSKNEQMPTMSSKRPIVPFGGVFSFGERHGAALIVGALVLSSGVHAALAGAGIVTQVTITPAAPTCRVGETIQLEALARTPWGSTPGITNSATWSVSNPILASHAGAGFIRCVGEGTSTVTASYGGKSSTVTLVIEPPLIMIEPPKEEEPPPPPPPPPEEHSAAASPNAPPEAKPTEAPPPPAAGKVGHLLTAPDDPKAQQPSEAHEFLSDENGNEYGSGTVAKGGTADHGAPGAVASGVPNGTGTGVAGKGPAAPPPPPTQVKPTVDLSRKPSLNEANACKGFFPADADDDVAQVQILVTVLPNGTVSTASVMSENPKGQGFGKAARSCLLSKKFSPGLDKDGNPTTTTAPVNVRFVR